MRGAVNREKKGRRVLHALVVEDDPDAAETMSLLLAAHGYTVAEAATLQQARQRLVDRPPDLVLLDLVLPDGSGLDLFDSHALLPTEVVLITGHASLETSIQALRLGAADYLIKPVSPARLEGVLSRVAKAATLDTDAQALQQGLEEDGHFGDLWGRSTPMRRVYERIARVAGSAVTVLLTGESGTGKELVAKTVHRLSRRNQSPFLALNCGAVSAKLIESELFGHEQGSFTGAHQQHHGYFERASGGTLFLDEITEMAPDLQVKLLRVLETGTFRRVGAAADSEADVRVIAATNRSLTEAVKAGRLREDLRYRLDVFPIDLPPLREHAEDIPLIAEHFLANISRHELLTKHFTAGAIARLTAQVWRGNVRELRNIVYRAYVMAGDSLTVDESALLLESAEAPAQRATDEIVLVVGTSLAEVARQVTLTTFEQMGQNREGTAAALGISLRTLYNRLTEYSKGQHSTAGG